MSKRLQLTVSDKRVEQLDVLATIRGVQPAVLARLLLMDAIEEAQRKVRNDNLAWRETLLEIDQRYSAR